MEKLVDTGFWQGKRVLLTGHTGFKGSWMGTILSGWGAKVTGYALAPKEGPSLFTLCGLSDKMDSVIGDIRDLQRLKDVFLDCHPEIVIHMAAQPLVLDSYENPVYTYQTNVMGTVNVLECVRQTEGVRSFLNVTTDKVYYNNEWEWGYREIDPLDGYDPYSNSKSCSELVTHSYKNSFFAEQSVAISTARAGNVIGGGDFAINRILPDCMRAALNGQTITVRNPHSVRPYQHVLEPIAAYLMLCEKQYANPALAGWYNIGPREDDCVTTGELVEMFCQHWANGQTWQCPKDSAPHHEANLLALDCSKIKATFGWAPVWDVNTAVGKTVEWAKAYGSKKDIPGLMYTQIDEYFTELKGRGQAANKFLKDRK